MNDNPNRPTCRRRERLWWEGNQRRLREEIPETTAIILWCRKPVQPRLCKDVHAALDMLKLKMNQIPVSKEEPNSIRYGRKLPGQNQSLAYGNHRSLECPKICWNYRQWFQEVSPGPYLQSSNQLEDRQLHGKSKSKKSSLSHNNEVMKQHNNNDVCR